MAKILFSKEQESKLRGLIILHWDALCRSVNIDVEEVTSIRWFRDNSISVVFHNDLRTVKIKELIRLSNEARGLRTINIGSDNELPENVKSDLIEWARTRSKSSYERLWIIEVKKPTFHELAELCYTNNK